MVESQFDWLLLRQWGIPAVAVSGTNVGAANAAILATKWLVILPHHDVAGEKAAKSWAKMAADAIILNYDTNINDINEWATLHTQEEFEELVRQQVGWISSLSQRQLSRFFPRFQTLEFSRMT